MRNVVIVLLVLISFAFCQDFGYTYVKLGGLLMDTPAGALIWGQVEPAGPSDEITEPYSGTFRLKIVEEIDDSSARFFNFFTGETLGNELLIDITDTSDNLLGFFDNQVEFIILYVEDTLGELKPTIPIGINITPSGSVAVKLSYDGPTRLPVDVDEMFLPIRVFAADESGLPVPDFYDSTIVMNAVQAKVIYESIDDGSASIYSLFSETPSDSVILPVLGGMAILNASDSEAEFVAIEVSDFRYDSLISDTIRVEFVDSGAFVLLASPMDGLATTVNYPASCISLAMTADNNPDESDDSTQISAEIMDITGISSAEIAPSERTLINGVSAFTVYDDEPDSFGVFVKTSVISGAPLISPFWSPILFLPASYPTRFFYDGPNAIAVGETADISIELTNDFGENPTEHLDYRYFFIPEIDEGTSIEIIDPVTDSIYSDGDWQPIEYDSSRSLKITASSVEDVDLSFADAERRSLFDNGYLKPTQTIEFSVLPVSGTLAGNYELYPPNSFWMFQTGIRYRIDIFAVDDADAVDTTYTGTVSVSVSGSATATPTVDLFAGHGTIYIEDNYSEDVILDIAGELASPPSQTLYFREPGSGGGAIILPEDGNDLLAGENRDMLIYVGTVSGISSYYSGTLSVSVDEPDDDGSVVCPATIIVDGGIGTLPFYDSEPETVKITLSGEGLVDVENTVVVSAELVMILPETLSIDSTYTVIFQAVDYVGNLCTSIGLPFTIGVVEEIDNSSFVYSGPYTPSFDAGICTTITISDPEIESVDIYLRPLEEGLLLVPDGDYDDEMGWYMGTVYFSNVGIDNKKPERFSVGEISPNPFNLTADIEIYAVSDGSVEIEIADITGKILDRFAHNLSRGENKVPLSFAGKPSGIYFVKILYNDTEILRRAIFIK